MYVCVSARTYEYTHARTCGNTRTRTYVSTYVRTLVDLPAYTRARASVCMDIRTRAYKHAYMLYVYKCTYTRVYTHTQMHRFPHAYMYTRTRICTSICTYILTYVTASIYIRTRVCIYTRTRPAIRNTLVFHCPPQGFAEVRRAKMILWAWWAWPTLCSGALRRQCSDKGPRKAESCTMRFDFNAS